LGYLPFLWIEPPESFLESAFHEDCEFPVFEPVSVFYEFSKTLPVCKIQVKTTAVGAGEEILSIPYRTVIKIEIQHCIGVRMDCVDHIFPHSFSLLS
jgi:hypothetical protein